MRILFSSEEVVEICDGKYYSMNLGQHLAKYSYMGDITCVCYCQEVKQTKLPEVDKKMAKFVFTRKENTLPAKIMGKRKNRDIVRRCAREVDAVIAHVPSWNSQHAIAVAKEMGIPYMTVVVGCIWDAMWNYDWRGKLLALPEYIKLKKLVAKSNHVLYVTEHFLQSRYPTKGKTEYASNVCIKAMPESVLMSRLARIEGYNKGCPMNIATVAAVDVRYKGQEYVIRAIAILNKEMGYNYHYYLIGGGDNSFLRRVAVDCGVEERVHFMGALPHESVTETLDKMDLYIQPSKQEGLPRALIEAMSRALPAIGTRVAGIPELLNDEYLIRKGSVDDIVDLLSGHMSPADMKRLAEDNFKKASEYTLDILNTRRKKFIDTFVQDCLQ